MVVKSPDVNTLNTTWKILIIDDDEDDFFIAREMLKEAKGRMFEVHWASSFAAGRDELTSNEYNAVLVDYDLGIHSGIELIREANGRGYAAPLILFTGRGSYEVDVEAMGAGATMYLTKSEVSPLLLERAIRYAMEIKQRENELREARETAERELAERKLVEEALQESERKYQAIFESAPFSLVLSGLDNGVIVDVNTRWEELFEVPREEAIGKTIAELFSIPDLEARGREYQELRERGRVQSFDMPSRTHTGKPFLARVNAEVMEINGKKYVLNMTEDVTRQKQAEEALQESELKYRSLFEHSVDAVLLTIPDGSIQAANTVACAMFGRSQEEICAIGRSGILDTNDPRLADALAERQRTGRIQSCELTAIRKDGERFPVEVDSVILPGNPIRSFVIIRDITGRKQAEEALRQALAEAEKGRQTLDAIMEYIPEGITIADGQDVTIRMVSRCGQEMLGGAHDQKTAEQIADQWNIYEPDGVTPMPTQQLPLVRAIHRGEVVRNQDLVQVNAAGKRLYLSCNAGPIRDAAGSVTGGVVAWRDISERKRAEVALAQSERRLAAALEIAQLGVWEFDVAAAMTYFDARCRSIFGLTDERPLSNAEVFALVHPADHQRVTEQVRQALEPGGTGRYETEYRIVRRDGTERWVAVGGHAIRADESSRGEPIQFVGTLMDITDRKQAEHALTTELEAAQRLQQVSTQLIQADNIEGLYDVILDTAVAVLHADFASLQILYPERGDGGELKLIGFRGFTAEAARFWEWVSPASESACGVALRTGQRVFVPNVLECDFMDGSEDLATYLQTGIRAVQTTPLFSRDGALLGMISTHWREPHQPTQNELRTLDILARQAADLIDRKQAEAALRESEEHFRQLADAMPQLVWTARPDGQIDYFNRRAEENYGVHPAEDGTWSWERMIHPDDMPSTLEAIQIAVQTGEIYQTEHRVRMMNGSYRWHLARGIPFKNPAGKVLRWYGTTTDIEDQKQIEARLRGSNQELEQFAFIASHDLQEPLRKIKMFGNSIQQKLNEKLDQDTQDNFQRMINASERMQAMIDDLLNISRISTRGRPFMSVDLSQIMAEVSSDLEPRILSTGGQVLYEQLPTIEADPIQMRQVFQNLIGNALKFHKPGVPPRVNVSSQTLQSPANQHRTVSILVEDNGIGFDEQQFETILQPFRRLHGRSQYEGTGIGLAIVKKIIERHHGEMVARSTPGVGSTFIITLPVKQTG